MKKRIPSDVIAEIVRTSSEVKMWRSLTILDFLVRTSFGGDLKLRMRIPFDVNLGLCSVLLFYGPK